MTNEELNSFADSVLRTVDRALQPPDPRLITIGCVMTNQARKDWGLAAAICAGLVTKLPNITFWWHVDTQLRYWSIPALIADYGLDERVEVTEPPMDDHALAARYRTCDLTLLPSLGEGFGLTLIESIACGVPCLHTDYAGGASLLRTCGMEYYLIEPVCFRLDTQHNCFRPVMEAWQWIEKIMSMLDSPSGTKPLNENVEHLQYMKLAHPWRRWLRDGLGGSSE